MYDPQVSAAESAHFKLIVSISRQDASNLETYYCCRFSIYSQTYQEMQSLRPPIALLSIYKDNIALKYERNYQRKFFLTQTRGSFFIYRPL